MSTSSEAVGSDLATVRRDVESDNEEVLDFPQDQDLHHEENVMNFNTSSQIVPYRFEPIPRSGQVPSTTESDSDSSDSSEEVDQGNNWCSCNKCSDMATREENKCCHFYAAVKGILGDSKKCITEHDGFKGNCLNPYVLEASVYEFVQDTGPLGDDEPVNELMRYLAYRRFVRWVFGKLGKKNRRVIPACAVLQIRQTFPSDFYHGFRYPIY